MTQNRHLLNFQVLLMMSMAFFPELSGVAQDIHRSPQRDLTLERSTQQGIGISIPRSYAVVIGVSRYEYLPEGGQLSFPERDAAQIYATLISAEGGQFPPENVHRLFGPQATLANMQHEIEEWLPSRARDGDRVLVYFAGHGFMTGDKAYLAPYDLDPGNIQNTGYRMTSLSKVLGSRIRAKWKVLLTDACHSGAILPFPNTASIGPALRGIAPSVFSLVASRDREQSFEGTQWGGGHGAFSYYVAKGMEGEADSSGDGVVTADELAEYVHVNVRRDTKEMQNPTLDQTNYDPLLIVAYNPTRVRVGPTAVLAYGRLVIEANMDGIEVLVDGKVQGFVSKSQPLLLPGIRPGTHVIKAVRLGYEPFGPSTTIVYPGQDTTISIRLNIAIHSKAARDLLDAAIRYYNDGTEPNYRKAVQLLRKALEIDSSFGRAAVYLARAYNDLYDNDKAEEFFLKAIDLDPDDVSARTGYAGILLERGDFDSAIRQLTIAEQHDPSVTMTHYMLCIAFARKEAFEEAIREGNEAIHQSPNLGEAHFWLAESLRLSGKCKKAEPEYRRYLTFTNFESGASAKIEYWVAGSLIGLGRKKHPAQPDIWRAQRSLAHFGLCDCARLSDRFDEAIGECQSALSYDSDDLFAHYDLALAFTQKFNASGNSDYLVSARKHFGSVVEINRETDAARKSREYIRKIDLLTIRGKRVP